MKQVRTSKPFVDRSTLESELYRFSCLESCLSSLERFQYFENRRKRKYRRYIDRYFTPTPHQILIIKAGRAVRKALRKGQLVKPKYCEEKGFCNREPLYFTHLSYYKEDWLKGRWLCHEHHVMEHKEDGPD
jgi:hypothetical protein